MLAIVFIDGMDGDYVLSMQELTNHLTVAILNDAKDIRIKITDNHGIAYPTNEKEVKP